MNNNNKGASIINKHRWVAEWMGDIYHMGVGHISGIGLL